MCLFCFNRGRKVFGGMFGMLKGLVGSKTLSQQDMEPVLEKMKDHLIGTPPLSTTQHMTLNYDVAGCALKEMLFVIV